MKAAIITISDSAHRGEREDRSSPVIEKLLKRIDADVAARATVPDEVNDIVRAVKRAAKEADVVVTTGGTGVSPRDVTPEAVRKVIEKELPGFGEAMRAAGLKSTPHAILSRSLAGVMKDGTVVICLPGSPRAVEESLLAVLDAVPHCVEVSKGRASECARKRQPRKRS